MFEYEAQSKGGSAITGTLEASSSEAAVEQLLAMGLSNVHVRPTEKRPAQKQLGTGDFIFFNEQLAALAKAGICLDEGLRQLGRDVHSKRLKSVLDAVADELRRGQPLPQVLEKHAAQMPALYSRVVHAGVKSGQLSATLINLSNHLRVVAETRRLLAEALTYPIVVLVLGIGLFSGVLWFVVPQFADVFQDFGVSLPRLTLLMMSLSEALPQLLIGSAIVFLAIAILYFASAGFVWGRELRERLVMHVPLIGSLMRNSLQSRFFRAMSFAIDSAMPLPEALRLAGGATGSPMLARDSELVAAKVESGMGLQEACSQSWIIPAIFGYFVDVKGNSATLRDGLIQLSNAAESRVAHSQAALRSWMTPMAIVTVGAIIGILIVALFLPLVQLIQSVSGG